MDTRDGVPHMLERDALLNDRLRGERVRLGQEAKHEVLGTDLVVACCACFVLRGHHDVPGPLGEAVESLLGIQIGAGVLRHEALAGRLGASVSIDPRRYYLPVTRRRRVNVREQECPVHPAQSTSSRSTRRSSSMIR